MALHQLCRLAKWSNLSQREIRHYRDLQGGPGGLQLSGGRPKSEIQKLSKSGKQEKLQL